MKLIKINEEHYIVVDDSNKYILDTKQNLSLQEVKELIGEVKVDIEKKALENFTEPLNKQGEKRTHPPASGGLFGFNKFKKAFRKGYNQALEDNKEKKYTEEDIRKAILMARVRIENVSPKYSIDEIFQSLQPKTEWEVEIVDGKLKLI